MFFWRTFTDFSKVVLVRHDFVYFSCVLKVLLSHIYASYFILFCTFYLYHMWLIDCVALCEINWRWWKWWLVNWRHNYSTLSCLLLSDTHHFVDQLVSVCCGNWQLWTHIYPTFTFLLTYMINCCCAISRETISMIVRVFCSRKKHTCCYLYLGLLLIPNIPWTFVRQSHGLLRSN